MDKVGRNSPCPCGSGKKFKKCCLNTLGRGISYQLNDMMQEGYTFLDKWKVVKACVLWLKLWESLKEHFSPTMKSIDDAECIMSGEQSLRNWCQELEEELHNAGLDDPSFYEKRIEYCREFCNFFPDTDSSIIHNMKRAEAETFFFIGNLEAGEMAFKALIEEFPDFAWGYIGWGDMYWLWRKNDNIPLDYERAGKIYRMALNKNIDDDDKQHVLDRLDDLEIERMTEENVIEGY